MARITVVNGRRKQPKKSAQKSRRTNPGVLTILGPLAANPSTGGRTMKKKTATKRPAKKRNPFVKGKASAKGRKPTSRSYRRSRNPSTLTKGADLLKLGVSALVGLVTTRQIPQTVLGESNTGIKGYLANGAVAFGAGYLANKLLGKAYGNAAFIGGGVYIANRLMNDYLSPVGKVLSLSGVGDAQAAGTMSGIVDAYFPVPVIDGPNGQPEFPAALTTHIRNQFAPAAPQSGVSGLRMAA